MPDQTTELVVHGPFEVPHDSLGKGTSKRITRDHAKEFWNLPEIRAVRAKRGCYVFALRVSRGFTPWYVGMSTKSFEKEVFDDHKLVHYNDVVYSRYKGVPVMFFVAPPGQKRSFPKSEIDELETYLIQAAVVKNPEIRNVRKTKMPGWTIRGVVRGGRGKAPANAKKFRAMMGL